jgi:hypothetical protein
MARVSPKLAVFGVRLTESGPGSDVSALTQFRERPHDGMDIEENGSVKMSIIVCCDGRLVLHVVAGCGDLSGLSPVVCGQ